MFVLGGVSYIPTNPHFEQWWISSIVTCFAFRMVIITHEFLGEAGISCFFFLLGGQAFAIWRVYGGLKGCL